MKDLNTYRLTLLLFGALFLFQMSLCGQYSGLPIIRSFEKLQYGAGTQNWDIDQDRTGRLYFANNDGLLIFNGSQWVTHRLPNRTIARSLAVDTVGHIYVGGQNEIGYFYPDGDGQLIFNSIVGKVPEPHKVFDDVWQVILKNGDVYWRASFKVFRKHGEAITVNDSESIIFLFEQAESLYVQNEDGILFRYHEKDNALNPFSNALSGQLITGYTTLHDGRVLICTESGEIWQLAGDQLQPWTSLPPSYTGSLQVTNISVINSDLVAISTVQSGILFFNGQGRFLYQLSKEDGLQTNNVICLFSDVDHNLWSGHSNGISQIMSNSPFSRILPQGELESTAFDAIIDQGNFYVANSLGLFSQPLSEGLYHVESPREPVVIKGTNGQAWGVDFCYGQLFLSHSRGLFIVTDNGARKIVDDLGFWMVREDPMETGALLAGTYEGIRRLRLTPDGATLSEPLGGLDESSRFMVVDENIIWMSHPYHGVFRYDRSGDDIRIDRFPEDTIGLPSVLQNHIFKVRNEVLVGAESGIYTFNDSLARFERNKKWSALFDKDEKVRRLFEGPSGEVWYITNRRVGVMRFIEEGLNIRIKDQEYPEIFTLLNAGWEKIYFHDAFNTFLPIIYGCLHYDPKKGRQLDSSFSVILTDVSIGRNYRESIYGGYGSPEDQASGKTYTIPYHLNNIKFDYTSTETQYTGDIQYRWKLEGSEDTWSDWSSSTSKEFTDLSYGDFVFSLECKNNDEVVRSTRFAFTVTTPWYHTLGFRIAMLILFLMPLGLYMVRSRKRYEDLKEEVAETVNRSERKIEALTKEKILAELEYKKRELISSTVYLAQKQESFSKISSMLSDIAKKTDNAETARSLKQIIRRINNEDTTDDQWEQLMYHFNRYDQNFIDNLKKEYPDLSSKDLKICTYLRMNLSTKEIANLLHVTTRSVEAYRYRLRKKMDLSSDDNLTEVIMNI